MNPRLLVWAVSAIALAAVPFGAYQAMGEGVAVLAAQAIGALCVGLWASSRLANGAVEGVRLGATAVGAGIVGVILTAGVFSYLVLGHADYYLVVYVMTAPFGVPGALAGGALGGWLVRRTRRVTDALVAPDPIQP